MADFSGAAGQNLAEDTLWDAAGDVAYGTGSDTGAVLTIGSACEVLVVACGLPSWGTAPQSTATFDNGTNNITSGGTWSVDVDATGTDSASLSAAGTLRFGVSQDLRIYHGGTHNYITGISGDLVLTTDGDGNGIILDAEDDTVEIKYSGTTGATFGTGGLCIVSGDAYSIAGNSVLNATTLGSAVAASSLTSVGTLTGLTLSGNIELGHASDTTIARSSAGAITVEGNQVYLAGGTDVPVADGGTGLSCLTTGSILIGTGSSQVTLVAMATKGHVLIGDGSGAPQTLSVGSNCQVLTACSGETTGVKWAAAGGGVSLSGSTNNTVATVTGSNALIGEGNLTFGCSTLAVTGAATVSTTLTVGSAGSGADVTFYSCTSGDQFLWDSSCEKLVITGTNGQVALCVADGNVVIADTLYFYDAGGEYISSNGSVLTITGTVNLATALDTAYGGTGLTCVTAGSVMIGAGTSDVALVDMATKGDILIGDGTTAPRVLDVGSNCQVLTAASGCTTGVKWATVSAGASLGLILALA